MVASKSLKKNILKNQKGQALVEFVLFFPFLLMMYSVTMSIANSINASINQQKSTRSYFYYRMQNNSTAPTPRRSDPVPFTRFGQHVNLWGVRLVDDLPVAACFKFNVPLGNAEADNCEDAYSNQTTQYIRVGTAYGICGATYLNSRGNLVRLPNYANNASPSEVVAAGACLVE